MLVEIFERGKIVHQPTSAERHSGVNEFSLCDKVFLIAEITSGAGLAFARAYGRGGARLIICNESASECEKVANQLWAEGIQALPIPTAFDDRRSVESLAVKAVHIFGVVDVLVCNLASLVPTIEPALTLKIGGRARLLSSNFDSVRWLAARLIPEMARYGGGSIIFLPVVAAPRNEQRGVNRVLIQQLRQLAREFASCVQGQGGCNELPLEVILLGNDETLDELEITVLLSGRAKCFYSAKRQLIFHDSPPFRDLSRSQG